MHDIVALEAQGVVGAFIASEVFTDASRAQATALGYSGDGVGAVFVPHPIQDRTDAEMRALAQGCVDAVVAAVTARP